MQLGQAGLILRRIGEASQGLAQPPLVIFTGDFNSTPESAIYTFVRDGELDCYTEDRRNLSGQLESDEKGWPPSDIARSRDFELRATLSGMDRKRVRLHYASMSSLCSSEQSRPFTQARQNMKGRPWAAPHPGHIHGERLSAKGNQIHLSSLS